MKRLFFVVMLLTCYLVSISQKDFTGIAKYLITVEGDSTKRTDSMAVIFGKDKIKIIFFMPDSKNWGIPLEKIFIDDFITGTTLDIDSEKGTYTLTRMKSDSAFDFVNTNRFGANKRDLCFVYEAKSSKLDHSRIIKAECLGSIDFYKPGIKNYFFLGVQPLIIDNRIVMDFTVTQKDGLKPRISLYQITRMDDTSKYFDMEGFVVQQ